MISDEAIEAAKEAMREVTPPPGVTKAEWLARHGDFALIAGALEAAAPYMLREANEPEKEISTGALIRQLLDEPRTDK